MPSPGTGSKDTGLNTSGLPFEESFLLLVGPIYIKNNNNNNNNNIISNKKRAGLCAGNLRDLDLTIFFGSV